MKNILSFATCLLAACCFSSLQAQQTLKLLNVQETTEGVGVYPCGDRHEAMVQFVTHEPFGLTFESTHDRPDQMQISVDSIAGKKTYSIVFVTQEPGKDYSNRRLTIRVPGFQDYRIPLPLKDKQLFEYTVSDPYSVLRSPFFNYIEKAQEHFNNSEYQKAKDNYELSRYCPEYLNDTAYVLQHIDICDSMLVWMNEAIEADHFFRYHDAANAYSKLLVYNGSEKLRQSMYNAQHNFDRDCEAMLNMGQKELDQGHLERAQQMFNQVIENGCTRYAKQARDYLEEARKAKQRRNDHSRSLMAEWSPNMWGISWGTYNRSRSGWNTTIMANLDFIDFLKQKAYVEGKLNEDGKFEYEKEMAEGNLYPKDKKMEYEALFTMGPTWHIWSPIYLHFGFGYHGGGFSTFDESSLGEANKKKSESDKKWEYTKINWFNGGALELGLVLKYSHAIVKATYQYTIWLNEKDAEDFCKDNTSFVHFGVGFCW